MLILKYKKYSITMSSIFRNSFVLKNFNTTRRTRTVHKVHVVSFHCPYLKNVLSLYHLPHQQSTTDIDLPNMHAKSISKNFTRNVNTLDSMKSREVELQNSYFLSKYC